VEQFGNGILTYFVPLKGLLGEQGYPLLFLVSFLASTVLPIGSELLLSGMLLSGYNPVATVAVATFGNTLGACTNWLIGRYGGEWVVARFFRISEQHQKRAEGWYNKYGMPSLLFSWLPVVGDPLCLVGGMLKVRFDLFLILVAVGKLGRYLVLAWVTLQAAG
jgi:membrane protein YqaA with SNARE-associated domain